MALSCLPEYAEKQQQERRESCIHDDKLFEIKDVDIAIEQKYQLGALCFASGEHERAKKWLKIAAENDSDAAQTLLGVLYAKVDRSEENTMEKAVYWLEKAAGSGNAQAIFVQGQIVGWSDRQKDAQAPFSKKSYSLVEQAANKGYWSAQMYLGYQNLHGSRVKKDEKKAVYWYTQAAKADNFHFSASCTLVDMYKKNPKIATRKQFNFWNAQCSTLRIAGDPGWGCSAPPVEVIINNAIDNDNWSFVAPLIK